MTVHESPYHEFPDFDALIARLDPIRLQVNAEYERLTKTIPNCTWNDARLTAIGHIGMLIDSTNISFTFMNENLLPLNNKWWEEFHEPPFASFNDYHKSATVNNFNNGFTKVSFLQNLFSIIDSTSRILLRKLDPIVANNARADIVGVLGALSARLTAKPQDLDDLLKLLRLTRNSIHNNGVFFPENNRDEHVIYKGSTYDFIQEQPITFVTWEFLIDRLENVVELVTQIVNDPSIIGINDEIPDPFGTK